MTYSIEQIKHQLLGQQLDKGFISDDVYDLLPPMLKDACNVFDRQQDREMFLISALPVCATLMRGARIATLKGKKGLNLAVWIYAPYGIGKGTAGMTDILLEGVKSEAAKRQQLAREEHRNEMDAHNTRHQIVKKQRQELIEQGRHDLPPLPVAPPPPSKEDITLPLYGHTKTLRDWVAENEGNALFMDTEADSLNRKGGEYGDLRLLFKQGIENEKSSNGFMSTGLQEWRSYISILITATEDQLMKFIEGPQDGLFSRFLYYGFEGNNEWISSQPVDGKDYTAQLSGMQAQYASLYDRVKDAAPTVTFSKLQWKDHDELFAQQKAYAVHTHSALAGSLNRLGHFRLRIAAILTIMRRHRSTMVLPGELVCDESSWIASKLICARLLRGLYDTWSLYNEEQLPTDQTSRGADYKRAKVAAAEQAKGLRDEGKNNVEIYDTIASDREFAALTCTWSGQKNKAAKKTAISRLITYIQR